MRELVKYVLMQMETSKRVNEPATIATLNLKVAELELKLQRSKDAHERSVKRRLPIKNNDAADRISTRFQWEKPVSKGLAKSTMLPRRGSWRW